MENENLAQEIAEEINLLGENTKQIHSELSERMDMIEVFLKRPGRQLSNFQDESKEVSEFGMSIKSAHNEKSSVVSDRQTPGISKSEYLSYVKEYSKYLRIGKETMGPDSMKALQVGIAPDGGFLAPPTLSNQIKETISVLDPIRRLASTITISSGRFEQPIDDEANSELEAVWEGETYGETTAPGNTKTMKLKKLGIDVHTLFARPLATQTLLEDAGINVEQWLANKLAKKFARDEAAAFVSGNGVGKPRGFLTYDDGTSWGQIEQVNSGIADAISADFFIDLLYSLKETYRDNAAFLMNNTSIKNCRKLKDGHGDYIWERSMTAGQPPTLLGIPVFSCPTMPEVAAGALAVAVADWREAYLIVDRIGIEILRDPFSQKPFVEFYTRKRVGGDVTNFEAIKLGKIAV